MHEMIALYRLFSDPPKVRRTFAFRTPDEKENATLLRDAAAKAIAAYHYCKPKKVVVMEVVRSDMAKKKEFPHSN